jgi:hypothetical protein
MAYRPSSERQKVSKKLECSLGILFFLKWSVYFPFFSFCTYPLSITRKKEKKSDQAFLLGKVCYPMLYPTHFASPNLKTIALMIDNAPTFMLQKCTPICQYFGSKL